MLSTRTLWLILALLLTLFCAACSEDDTVLIPPEDTTEPPPTPDLMMHGFETAMEGMDADVLDWVLNEDFRLILLDETIDEWAGGAHPLLADHFDRTAMDLIHQNIFGQVQGVDPLGNIVEPIESIDVGILEKLTPWTEVDSGWEYFGDFESAHVARYAFLIHFNKPDGSRFEADQIMDVVGLPVTVDGEEGYEMLGIIPLPETRKGLTDRTSYDGILTLYR